MADIFGAEISLAHEMKKMLHELDLMDENVSKAVSNSMKKAAEVVAEKQRECIRWKSPKLAGLIRVLPLRVGKRGQINAYCGYDTEAVKNNMESVVLEFGRPGKKSKGKIMEQTYTRKNGSKYTVWKRIGKMEAISHIRKGFDMAKNEAASILVEEVKKVTKW